MQTHNQTCSRNQKESISRKQHVEQSLKTEKIKTKIKKTNQMDLEKESQVSMPFIPVHVADSVETYLTQI